MLRKESTWKMTWPPGPREGQFWIQKRINHSVSATWKCWFGSFELLTLKWDWTCETITGGLTNLFWSPIIKLWHRGRACKVLYNLSLFCLASLTITSSQIPSGLARLNQSSSLCNSCSRASAWIAFQHLKQLNPACLLSSAQVLPPKDCPGYSGLLSSLWTICSAISDLCTLVYVSLFFLLH